MRAAFLDRDGVINRNAPTGDYIKTVRELEILPGVPEAIRLLNERGYRVIVVTNQRGVSRGIMTVADVEQVHDALRSELSESGASLDAIYYCPHAEGSCDCRKPQTGMFLRALRDFPDIDLRECVVVGDSRRDMEAAQALNCHRMLITDTEAGRQCAHEHGIEAAGSLLEAVRLLAAPENG
jgi:histidinol-phosphate phosphatase family protein